MAILRNKKLPLQKLVRCLQREKALFGMGPSVSSVPTNMARVLFVEPYFGGSHKQLLDTLVKGSVIVIRYILVEKLQ